MPQWYREFFDDLYLRLYHWLEDPERVRREVDFVVNTLDLEPKASVLDLCCGQGRHSLELARRGFQVTSVDLSEALLYVARQRAEQESLQITFIQSDMREIDFHEEFDAVINLFTSFGYLENEAEDEKALQRVAAALKQGRRFLLDVFNRDYIVRSFQGRDWRTMDEGWLLLEDRSFDFLSGRVGTEWIAIARDGVRYVRHSSIRAYTAAELRAMMERVGLKAERLLGDYRGNPYDWNSPRLIVVAQKLLADCGSGWE